MDPVPAEGSRLDGVVHFQRPQSRGRGPDPALALGEILGRLPNGAFTTALVGAKVIYGFSPRAFLDAFLQYNADTHLVSSNIRFDLIHRPLSDVYIVYNDTRDTALGQVRERAFVVKVTNLFTF